MQNASKASPLPRLKRTALPKPPFPRPRLAFVAAAHDWGDLLINGNAKLILLQHPDFVAQSPSLFKFKVARRFAHFFLKFFDVGAQIVADHVGGAVFYFDQNAIAVRNVSDDIGDVAFD
jgi:hypothetical protein